MKGLIGTAILLPVGIGVLWAGLYWRSDLEYGSVILLINVLVGALFALAVRATPRLRALINPTGLLCGVIALLWWAPIALSHIDSYYVDIKVEFSGIALSALTILPCFVLGVLIGNQLHRFNLLVRFSSLLALVLVVPTAAYLLAPDPAAEFEILKRFVDGSPRHQAKGSRVAVLGIDGGTWDVILPLLKQGKLPNLRMLMEKGQYGILNSVTTSSGETASPAVWTSVFTGMRPGKHGISSWLLSDSRNRVVKSLWNIVDESGELTITVNIPATFPPEVVRGAQISGFPIPGIVKASSMRFHVSDGRLYSTRDRTLNVVPLTPISMRPTGRLPSGVVSYSPPYRSELPLIARLEMKHGALNHAAHELRIGNLWIELMERRGVLQSRALRTFPLLVVDSTDDDTVNYDTVYMFARDIDEKALAVFEVGQWSDWISVAIKSTEVRFKIRLLTLSGDALELYATPLFQSSFDPQIPFTYPLDLASSLSNQIGQYVVEGAGWTMFADPVTLDALFEHLLDVGAQHVRASEMLLQSVPDWRLFAHVFTEVDRVSHPFWRFHQPEAYPPQEPELVARHGGKIDMLMEIVDAQIGRFLELLDDSTTVVVVSDHGFGPHPASGTGQHRIEGIYIFSGRSVRPSGAPLNLAVKSFAKASVMDITPTLLYLMGYPVARDMDGRVMTEIVDNKWLDCCPLESIETYGPIPGGGHTRRVIDKATEEQLKSLGYIE